MARPSSWVQARPGLLFLAFYVLLVTAANSPHSYTFTITGCDDHVHNLTFLYIDTFFYAASLVTLVSSIVLVLKMQKRMKCKECGKRAAWTKFCQHCGARDPLNMDDEVVGDVEEALLVEVEKV